MRAFQNFCAEVPRWNQDVIDTNINKILDNCRCDYIEELMTAVFIAHTKMLTAIRVSSKQKKLSITLPKLDHFLHRVFTECARAFWKAPFLFADSGSSVEKQKNILQAESLCIDAVSSAVRSLLPVKNILRDYLDESDSDEETIIDTKKKKVAKAESDSEEEAEPVPTPLTTPEPVAAPAPSGPFGAKPVDEPLDVEAVELESPPTPKAAEKPAPVVVQKLETSPPPPAPTVSNHEVKEIETKESVKVEKLEVSADPPKLLIDTEPAVHFTPYDTVFDENKPGVSEIRYSEKVSIEDKPPSNWGIMDDDEEEDVPKLSISSSSSSLGLDEIEDLDAPAVPFVSAVTPEEDIDEPLGATLDFESLD